MKINFEQINPEKKDDIREDIGEPTETERNYYEFMESIGLEDVNKMVRRGEAVWEKICDKDGKEIGVRVKNKNGDEIFSQIF